MLRVPCKNNDKIKLQYSLLQNRPKGTVQRDFAFVTGVVETGGKLPPVSTTPAVPVATFTLGLLIPVANLPPVSLIQVVHFDLRIRVDPNVILWGLGEDDP